ncbi:Chloride channel protein CLC-d, partial [Cucurbita argyrosperma subsp. argyrosperma]
MPTRHNFSEFVKPASSKGISIDDINLSSEDLEMYIDLLPFLNPSPYIVPEDMSLTKVYNLFRQLGLRHAFVVPRPANVVGLITRKDLLIEDSEDSDAMELQSTSVRARRRDRRIHTANGDVESPLLNGLLVNNTDG